MTERVTDRFLERIREQIDGWDMLPNSSRWLLAVSGGADSIAMMHAMVMLQRAGIGISSLHVAHLNHQLRGAESNEDAGFVQQQAHETGLTATIESVDVAGAAKEKGESIEEAARGERYRFFLDTARKMGCQAVATAHTSDDNVETVLHRILRGTAMRGLAGIPPVRELGKDGEGKPIRIVRPLLEHARCQVEGFLAEQGLTHRHDQSNLSREYTRNRIRHDLLPLLREQYNPNIDDVLASLGRTARWLQEALREDVATEMCELVQAESQGRLIINAAKIASFTRIQQAEILLQVLARMEVGQQRIGFKHITAVLDLLREQRGAVQLPGRLTIKREGENLILLQREIDSHNKTPLPTGEMRLLVPGETELPGGHIIMETEKSEPVPLRRVEVQCLDRGQEYLQTFREQKTRKKEIIDAETVRGTLMVRPWRTGDRFAPLGAGGSKTVGDFLADSKVPQGHRRRMAILCDDEGIVWVIGMRIAERVKVTAPTKHLLLITAE